MYKTMHGRVPAYLSDIFAFFHSSENYNLRQSNLNLELPKNRTEYYSSSFAFSGAKLWNSLPEHVKTAPSLRAFIKRFELLSALN